MVPDSLQERLEVIEVPGYAEDEKLDIARRFLLPRQLHDHGLTPRDLRISHAALRTIVRHYTLEAGVRGLSRQLAMICRKVARARATGDMRSHHVVPGVLEEYVGHRQVGSAERESPDLQEATTGDAVAIPVLGTENGQHGGITPWYGWRGRLAPACSGPASSERAGDERGRRRMHFSRLLR